MEIPTNKGIKPDFHLVKIFASKLTFPFMLFTTISTIIYSADLTSKIDANFVKIGEFQVWRIVTSVFGSSTSFYFVLNLVWLRILSNLSEKRRGSLPFVLDILLKGVVINSFSIVIFSIIYACSKRFELIFKYAVSMQQNFVHSGYSGVLITEIFYIILNTRLSLDDLAAKEETRNLLRLKITLVLLILLYLPYSQSMSALLLAFLNKKGIFLCVERFKVSQTNFNVEQKLKRFERFFYFYFIKPEEEREYYENKEKIKISKDDRETTDEDKTTEHGDKDLENGHDHIAEEEEPEESEVNKSRYEDVDVNDYILEHSKNKNPKEKEPDSFEI